MGRHSIPDPEESAGSQRPEEPATERFGYAADGDDHAESAQPAYHDYGIDEYGADQYEADQYGADQYEADQYEAGQYEADQYGADEYDPGDHPAADYAPVPPPADDPASAPRASGPQHNGDWDGGEWTGSHRAVAAGRRGVSIGVVGALITVVVVVGAFIVWRFFGDALSDRSGAAAARCVNGDLAVDVLVDPSITDQIKTLGNSFNETADPVGDRCVKVAVKPAESDRVVTGFTGAWPAELGDRPALWIPASSVSAARLEAAAGAKTISDSRSLVSTPVLLAIRPQLKDALAQQNWAALPGLQSNPTALDGVGLPGWGALRLVLPRSGNGDATYLAAEAIAAAAAPGGAPPSAGAGAVSTVVAAQPKLADTATATAMDALIGAPDPATAPVHAVITTEQQLFARAASTADAKNVMSSWLPPGPTALADYPTVLLSGDWLSPEQVSAASEFARFMRKPEQLAVLAKAGFRTDGATPPQSDITSFAPLSAPLSVGDNAMRATLADAVAAPVGSPAVTIMLDQSMAADDGGSSRLGNVTAALDARLQALTPSSAVGLWTFDGAEGRSEVSTGRLSDPLGGQPRSSALRAALGSQAAAAGGAVSFTTLRLAYTDATSNYRNGQPNSILVITAGPHTDQTMDGAALQSYIRDAFDPARPVAVNVIDFGSDPDRATWEDVAQSSGGTYRNLTTSNSPDLSSAISTMVG